MIIYLLLLVLLREISIPDMVIESKQPQPFIKKFEAFTCQTILPPPILHRNLEMNPVLAVWM